ncbi:hypothetical protein C8J57DRAFT_1269865 [Mycena rebaudengoi]|nr:hypothetical protein C8J57DRAFT_1269865 [Mycena rebaudengoi]
MAARTHTHVSNRAKSRDTLEKKVVFKSVLDSPFRIQWPSVPVNLQNTALALTVGLLDGVSEYHHARGEGNRKRKRRSKDSTNRSKKRKIDADSSAASTTEADVILLDDTGPSSTAEDKPVPDRPAVLSHLTIGINEVTKRLDAQIRSARNIVALKTTGPAATPAIPAPAHAAIKIILVCRADVDPPILIDHLPHEVAAFNSSRPAEPIKIIPLPEGAEFALAKVIGLRRVAAMALDIDTPGLAAFTSLLEAVPTLTAPWLTSLAPSAKPVKHQLVSTHVKQLRTTAPKDMKAAKELRATGKAAAKARKKSSKLKKTSTVPTS